MNPCPFLLCLYFVAHNVVRCKETDGQVIRPAFVDGGQEWSSTVCYILKYGLTFFCLPPFPVTPVHKFPAMPVDKQIHLATRIV